MKCGISKLVMLSMVVASCAIARAHDSCCLDPGDDISKTFFTVRPHFQSFSPEKDVFYRDSFIFRSDEDRRQHKFEVTAFGSKSGNQEGLARYFLPNGKSSILVASDNADSADERDVDAKHLNIDHENGEFESIVSFCPEQTAIGAGIQYKHWFSRTSDHGIWIDFSFPVVRVENKINMCESIINEGDTVVATRVANVTEAFKQDDWCYGKIDNCCSMRSTGVGDIEIKLGYEGMHTDTCHAQMYMGVLAPTGDKPTAYFMFEPIVGNNRHWAFLTGAMFAVKCWQKDDDKSFTAILTVDRRFLFEREQLRTFDLKNKPWSRYMEVYANQASAETADANAGDPANGDKGSPGVNVFTQCAKVKPGFNITINNGWLFVYKGLHAEFGYSMYGRQKEEIKICCDFADGEQPALVGAAQGGSVTKARTIKDKFVGTKPTTSADALPDEYADAALSTADFDVWSAAHPAFMSHLVYGSLGYGWEDWDYPLYVGVGGSYEFGSNNKTLQRWTAWGNVGVSF